MMPCTTAFQLDRNLILVRASLAGPRGRVRGTFVLDTGASMTTIVPGLADELGYSARDGHRLTHVQTAMGQESGYTLSIKSLHALGVTAEGFLVHVFDLGYPLLQGLLGMNFLLTLDYQIRSLQRTITVEPARAKT